MRMRSLFSLLSVLILLSGCVSSYKSLDEVPDARRPACEATYNYMQCSVDNLTSLLEAGKLSGGEQELDQLAAKACEACGTELLAYSEFIRDRTGSREVADAEAAKLRSRTQEYMVRDVLEQAAAR